MIARRYTEVDVFSPEPYRGNPLAVVHDAEGLTTEQMQSFARWTNLSETTFLLAPTDPTADYRVRIFTPRRELPFAGHPTLGSAFAWRHAGGVPKDEGTIVQECGTGLVPVRASHGRLAFEAPPLTRFGAVDEAIVQQVADALRIARDRILDASWLVNGPQWIGVALASAEEVLALKPDARVMGSLEVGVVGPHEPGAEAQIEVRAFDGGDTLVEDPVTGSLNAAIAQWAWHRERVDRRYIAAQGTALGVMGRVHIDIADGVVWVGGDVTACVTGEVVL